MSFGQKVTFPLKLMAKIEHDPLMTEEDQFQILS